jgi:hypothetical protein
MQQWKGCSTIITTAVEMMQYNHHHGCPAGRLEACWAVKSMLGSQLHVGQSKACRLSLAVRLGGAVLIRELLRPFVRGEGCILVDVMFVDDGDVLFCVVRGGKLFRRVFLRVFYFLF